jgi:PH domain
MYIYVGVRAYVCFASRTMVILTHCLHSATLHTKGETPQGLIRISARSSIEKILPGDVPRGSVRRAHLFVMVSDPYQNQAKSRGRPYYISCASDEERTQWVDAILANVKAIQQKEKRHRWKRSLRYQ